jgi:energy coupling factor transporter S component ThiW
LTELRQINKNEDTKSLKIVMVAVFTAIGVILSYLNPFAYTTLFGTKINPFAHLMNAVTGVLLGPWYAVLTAFLIAIIRYTAGIGSIHAFPGGIPGALVVGLISVLFSKQNGKYRIFAAFFEPIGTVFIGATISAYISGTGTLLFWWGLFAASCIPGSLMGLVILIILKKRNITYDKFE